jgi:hypothetical protein
MNVDPSHRLLESMKMFVLHNPLPRTNTFVSRQYSNTCAVGCISENPNFEFRVGRVGVQQDKVSIVIVDIIIVLGNPLMGQFAL